MALAGDQPGGLAFADAVRLAPALTAEQFDALDTDDDQLLDADDFAAPPPDPRERLHATLRNADANADGAVTPQEAVSAGGMTLAAFAAADRDGDGLLTAADAPDSPAPSDDEARHALLQALAHGDAFQDGRLDYHELCGAFPDAPAAFLTLADADADGALSRPELRAVLGVDADGTPSTPLADVNADGRVNAVDMQTAVNDLLGRPSDLLPADLDGDGRVNSVDVQLVVRWMLTGE
jgi:hypothetical protein